VNRLEPKLIDGQTVGIDLGLNNFATIYNGETFEIVYAPKPLSRKLRKLKRLCRQQSRTQKKSNNRGKANLRLARLYRHIKNIRGDCLNKLTTRLAKTKSAIVIENLTIRNMNRNHTLARSISDVGWGRFRRLLEYKTEWYGSKLIILGRFEPTSKTCSECGAINKELTLSDRQWVCTSCGAVHDRDENAAKNIRNRGLIILATASSAGSNACGVDVRPLGLKAIDSETGNKPVNIDS
jgi:putative transposase